MDDEAARRSLCLCEGALTGKYYHITMLIKAHAQVPSATAGTPKALVSCRLTLSICST